MKILKKKFIVVGGEGVERVGQVTVSIPTCIFSPLGNKEKTNTDLNNKNNFITTIEETIF